MNERVATAERIGITAAEELPDRVELWDESANAPERVLARAANQQLARAIFRAAQKEHPDRRILLRRASRTIADSAG